MTASRLSGLAGRAGEDRVVGVAAALVEPAFDNGHRGGVERGGPLFPTIASAGQIGAGGSSCRPRPVSSETRFEFSDQPKKHSRFWLHLEHRKGEVCATCPGEEDLVVIAEAEPFVRWHMGHLSWSQAVSDGGVRVVGPPALARAFPPGTGGATSPTFAR